MAMMITSKKLKKKLFPCNSLLPTFYLFHAFVCVNLCPLHVKTSYTWPTRFSLAMISPCSVSLFLSVLRLLELVLTRCQHLVLFIGEEAIIGLAVTKV